MYIHYLGHLPSPPACLCAEPVSLSFADFVENIKEREAKHF
jgi:hypothetical protein